MVHFTDAMNIALIIEHPDMPEVGELAIIPIVYPKYTRETVLVGNPKRIRDGSSGSS